MSEVVIDNHKEHFILHDSLNNLMHDVTFSVFKKYNCKAGCKICYIRDDFLPDEKFRRYIPVAPDVRSYTERLLNFFSYFNMAATIDDMWMVQHEHPELFKFYQEYGSVFWLSSMTDNAIFRHLSTIEDGVEFQGIREISISEQFLYSVSLKKLLDALDRIQKKAKIMKIKAILRGSYSEGFRALQLKKWCEANDVLLTKQYEYGTGDNGALSALSYVPNVRYSDDLSFTEVTTFHEVATEIFPIHSEALFLMYDDFYSELKSATAEGFSQPFATLSNFDDPLSFLTMVLHGKITDYRRYAETIKNKESVYYKYFRYVVDNLVINRDFNFIPRVAFKPFTTYHRKIVESGSMVDTQYGLVKPGAETIAPIFTFKTP